MAPEEKDTDAIEKKGVKDVMNDTELEVPTELKETDP